MSSQLSDRIFRIDDEVRRLRQDLGTLLEVFQGLAPAPSSPSPEFLRAYA